MSKYVKAPIPVDVPWGDGRLVRVDHIPDVIARGNQLRCAVELQSGRGSIAEAHIINYPPQQSDRYGLLMFKRSKVASDLLDRTKNAMPVAESLYDMRFRLASENDCPVQQQFNMPPMPEIDLMGVGGPFQHQGPISVDDTAPLLDLECGTPDVSFPPSANASFAMWNPHYYQFWSPGPSLPDSGYPSTVVSPMCLSPAADPAAHFFDAEEYLLPPAMQPTVLDEATTSDSQHQSHARRRPTKRSPPSKNIPPPGWFRHDPYRMF